jgi:hypothetical protein
MNYLYLYIIRLKILLVSVIIPGITQRRLRWSGHLAHVDVKKLRTGFWLVNLKERNHFEEKADLEE